MNSSTKTEFVFCNGAAFSYDADLSSFDETIDIAVDDDFVKIYNKETKLWETDYKISARKLLFLLDLLVLIRLQEMNSKSKEITFLQHFGFCNLIDKS
uniref:Uncharacterized protein n=1 Tax=viral metagenome TaxID=1070528 RepID=A0A6C0C7H9_9ZZZZ